MQKQLCQDSNLGYPGHIFDYEAQTSFTEHKNSLIGAGDVVDDDACLLFKKQCLAGGLVEW